MDLKQMMRDYHKILMILGIGAGLLCAIDATKLYDIGFSVMHWGIHFVIIVFICIGGVTYYSLFWNVRFRPSKPQRQPPTPTPGPSQGQRGEEARNLEDLGGNQPPNEDMPQD